MNDLKKLHADRMKMWNASIGNHDKYLEKISGLEFDDKYVEQRMCPICDTNSTERYLFNKSGGSYVKCTGCNLIYLNPVFKDDALIDYYTNNHDVQAQIVAEDLTFYNGLYDGGLKIIGDQANKRILDFGCSSGGFLDRAKLFGWECFGIEINNTEANVAKSKGYQIYRSISEAPGLFDAITLWDVFEHIKDGKRFVEGLLSKLNDKGVIFIQTPNTASLAPRILRENCNMFDGLEHTNLYDEWSIKAFAERMDLNITYLSTVIPEIPVINNYLNYEAPYTGNFNGGSDSVIGLIDKDTILKKNLGYKLQVVLSRKS